MTKFVPFKYTDTLEATYFNADEQHAKISENGNPEILLILRILSGTVKINHEFSNKEIILTKNFFKSDCSPCLAFREHIPELFGEGYSLSEFSEFIQKAKFTNRDFYKDLLLEISNFFLHTNRDSHTTAFLYLYRTLEFISYAFPLIYTEKTNDFKGSYNNLKQIFSGDKNTGELGFFKKFIETIFKDDPIKESNISFQIDIENEDIQRLTYKALYDACDSSMISEQTVENTVLSVPYTEIGSFIVTIRNRFFHFLNGGKKNIKSENVCDSDLLFSLLNEQCLFWLSSVFLEIIKSRIEKYT
jgi:hypothetical protein